ncbi:NAD(P)H-quinone oxidoreductase subunit S, chloroplastic [Hordeum vulgare]|nr:NAD(P)H-quinone oxidoreductase subunit S, chloroplastic [Hordeum vulgare]
MAPAPTTPSFHRPPPLHPHRICLPAPPPSASFRLSEILGGRGLCNGEVSIRKELLSPTPPSPPPSTPSGDSSSGSVESDPPMVDPDAFEKARMGLTGGFRGGEVGLKDFVAKNPPPLPKRAQTDGKASSAVVSLLFLSRAIPHGDFSRNRRDHPRTMPHGRAAARRSAAMAPATVVHGRARDAAWYGRVAQEAGRARASTARRRGQDAGTGGHGAVVASCSSVAASSPQSKDAAAWTPGRAASDGVASPWR